MLIKLYRKIPAKVRREIYDLFLGKLLAFIRYPRTPMGYYSDYRVTVCLKKQLCFFENKSGLEIGGGTFMFTEKGSLPIYALANNIDGCNFSNKTIWEGCIKSDIYMYKGIELGHQYIGEATRIDQFIDKQYDFIISSNCLEHIANPLKAIKNWLNSLKTGGRIFLVLPNKQSNFDHKRPDTVFSHLLSDYQEDISENDLTHFDEIIKLHDLRKDLAVKNIEFFLERSKKNNENRCFHHHVFTTELLIDIFNYFELNIIFSGKGWSNIYIIGEKHENIRDCNTLLPRQ